MQSAASLPTSAPARARYDEPVWRRALDWFERSNALAAREVRMALRSPRAWLLLSLYVSVLGAVVLAQFPADTTVEMWAGNTSPGGGAGYDSHYSSGYSSNIESSQRGQELLGAFTLAQFFGVWLLVPSLAVGALHQEREGQTLESLLLSPLSPLQIVWGKLCGVLAMAFVLLLGTLPLTSLCFLLGGVAPEDVAIRFFGLLAWAMFAAGIGLYCAARTANVAKATAQAYAFSLGGLAVALVMLGPGIALASVGVLVWLARHSASLTRGVLGKLMPANGARPIVNALTIALVASVFVLAPWYLVPREMSWVLVAALLVFPYGVYVSQIAVSAAAHEIAKRPDPAPPKREAWREVSQAWATAAPPSAVYARMPDGSIAQAAPVGSASSTWGAPGTSPSTSSASKADAEKSTYNTKAFLSDKWNPIFARDLRHGVGGKAATLARWAYCAVIATQMFLIYFLSNSTLGLGDSAFLANCVKLQVILVMMACAWLGSRAIAPERETQTLGQLLTLPMPASGIIGGKIASVLYFSLYVMLAGLPLVLMLPLAFVLGWGPALGIVILQAAWGVLAASWGVFCSLHCGTVRRALVWSLGGVAFGLFGAALLQGALSAAQAGGLSAVVTQDTAQWIATVFSPLSLVQSSFRPVYATYASYSAHSTLPWGSLAFSILGAGLLALALFGSSVRAFAKLAHEG